MKAKLLTFVRGLQTGTSPQFQSYLKSLTLILVMCLSIGNAWGGTTYTITEDQVSSTTSYSTSEKTFTVNSCKFGYINAMTNNSNNTPTGWCKNQVIQTKSGGNIYNKAELNVTQVEIVTTATCTFTIYKGITEKPTSGSSVASSSITPTDVTNVSYSQYASKKCSSSTTTLKKYTIDLSKIEGSYITLAPGGSMYIWEMVIISGSSTPEAPSITTHPLGATYDKGAVATALTIAASGNPTPTYQWYSNTTNSAVVDNDHKISGATNASYTPSTSTTGDTYYYCVATNSEGSATSNIAKVIVNAPKTLSSISVSTQPTKKSYNTCETLDLTGCVVKAKYSDNSEEDVTSSCTFNPANGAALTISVTSVAVSYNGKETSISDVSVTQGARDTFQDDMHGKATQYGDCNGYTIPSLDDETKGTECVGEHYKFIGWSSSSITSGSTTEPAGLLKAGDTHNANGTTYHAVWAKEKEAE